MDMTPRGLYLDLMKRCLLNLIYTEAEGDVQRLWKLRQDGSDDPPLAHSMIGWERLSNLQQCCQRVLWDNVPWHFIEAGVWRGGATILMRAILLAYGNTSKKVYVADSFAGLPKSSPEYTPDYHDDFVSSLWKREDLKVSVTQVEENFRRYGLLDDQVVFVKGWFKDTLHQLNEPFSVVRLDGDMYESTRQSIEALYPRLSVGGFLIVDDYGMFAQCRQAIHEYRDAHGVDEEVVKIDWTGAYWRKQHDIRK